MKNLLRYGFFILVVGLLQSMTVHAIEVSQHRGVRASQSCYKPQAQAHQDSMQLFHFIYSHSLSGTVEVSQPTLAVKSLVRSFNLLDITKGSFPMKSLEGQCYDVSLYRDPVRYYIFTLEKIII